MATLSRTYFRAAPVTALITMCGPFWSEPLQLKFDARCFPLSSGLVWQDGHTVRVIFWISSALGASVWLIATHESRHVLITFTSFKHRIEIVFIFIPILFGCLMHCRLPATGKSKNNPESSVGQFAKCLRDYRKGNLLGVAGGCSSQGKGRVWTIDWYSSWPLLRLRQLFTKVITWPRLCCDPITAVSTQCVCASFFTSRATRDRPNCDILQHASRPLQFQQLSHRVALPSFPSSTLPFT